MPNFPDTISTDITKGHAEATDPVIDMPNTMSKLCAAISDRNAAPTFP